VRAGRRGRYASDFETGGFAAIRFHPVGNVSGMTREQVTELVASERPGKRSKVSGDTGMLYSFANEIEVGDIIVTPDGGTRELLFGEVAGPYEYRETPAVSNFLPARQEGRMARTLLPRRVAPEDPPRP
jgi:predicted Mrr-cat superfamily restriction endonuclease